MMINENFALFYGILLGDGCLSKVGKCRFISISCNFHSDQPFINSILSSDQYEATARVAFSNISFKRLSVYVFIAEYLAI